MGSKPNRFAKPKHPPRPVDEWLEALELACAKAVGRYLLRGIDVKRRIESLTPEEMRGLASAATAQWIVMVSRRAIDNPPAVVSEKERAYFDLLGI